jgi:uncharacterized protein YbaP (TraB family)
MPSARALRRCLLIVAFALAGGGWALPAAAAAAECPPQANPPSADEIAAGTRDARDRGFLWRIEKNGQRSYLYGTIHVGRPAWMFLGPQVTQALLRSDTVALEIDLADPDMQRAMRDGMASRRSVALPERLKTRLQRQLRAECLAPEALATLSPEMQVATLSLLVARRDGLDPSYGIDLAVGALAQRAGKRVVSLETADLQLSVLQAASSAQALASVASGLDDIESGRARPQLVRVAQVWADADLAELSRYASWCDCMKTASDRDAMKRLVDDRNPGLAGAIDALHTKDGGHVFAAVGSLHMIGPKGLPALLAARGYHVERVTYAP